MSTKLCYAPPIFFHPVDFEPGHIYKSPKWQSNTVEQLSLKIIKLFLQIAVKLDVKRICVATKNDAFIECSTLKKQLFKVFVESTFSEKTCEFSQKSYMIECLLSKLLFSKVLGFLPAVLLKKYDSTEGNSSIFFKRRNR